MTKEKVYEQLFDALLKHTATGVRISQHCTEPVVLVGDKHYHLDSWKPKERQARDLTNWLNELK